jgi:phage shock protein A
MARAKEQLEAKTAEARAKLLQLDGQARAAVTAGRDDVARFVLHRRVAGGDELDGLERQVTEIEQEEGELTLVEQRLEAQIETFFARREVIAARYSTAEAHVEVREALGGVSDELAGLGTALERAEQTTDRMQARASALDHLAGLGVLDDPGDPLEGDSAPVETGGTRSEVVEEKLASLKREASAG